MAFIAQLKRSSNAFSARVCYFKMTLLSAKRYRTARLCFAVGLGICLSVSAMPSGAKPSTKGLQPDLAEPTQELAESTPTPVDFIALYGGEDSLLKIYQLSGAQLHLESVFVSVLDEVTVARGQCADGEPNFSVVEIISSLYSAASLERRFVSYGDKKMTPLQRSVAIAWYESQLGQRFLRTEKDALDLTEGEFSIMVQQYVRSPEWSVERKALIVELLSAIRADELMSSVNAEISAAVAIAGTCATGKEAVARAQNNIDGIRDAEPLFRQIMAGELVRPTAAVFAEFSDQEIKDYIRFASSEAGQQYHESLLLSVTSAIQETIPEIADYLTELAVE